MEKVPSVIVILSLKYTESAEMKLLPQRNVLLYNVRLLNC